MTFEGMANALSFLLIHLGDKVEVPVIIRSKAIKWKDISAINDFLNRYSLCHVIPKNDRDILVKLEDDMYYSLEWLREVWSSIARFISFGVVRMMLNDSEYVIWIFTHGHFYEEHIPKYLLST